MLTYVDDIIVSGLKRSMINYLIHIFGNDLSLHDLGDLGFFLGIEVIRKK